MAGGGDVDTIAVPKLMGKVTSLSQDGSFSEAGVCIQIAKQVRKEEFRTKLSCHVLTGDRDKEDEARSISEQFHFLVLQNQSHPRFLMVECVLDSLDFT